MADTVAAGDRSGRLAPQSPGMLGHLTGPGPMADNFDYVWQWRRSVDVQIEMSEPSPERIRLEVEALRASRERLLRAADDDRRRLERELHNGLQQHLVALAADLQLARRRAQADGHPANPLLDEAEADVHRALAAAASLAHRIYPPLLDAGGLASALRVVAADVGASLTVQGAGREGVPPGLAGSVYFCCLDVLENAGSAPVAVAVRQHETGLRFEIDVGDAGAISEPVVGRLRDRVEALGGVLTSQARPGQGDRLTGSLPLAP